MTRATRGRFWRFGRRATGLLLAACLLAGVATQSAAASKPPRHHVISAIDVYRERVPTSDGPKPVGSGSGSGLPLSSSAGAALSPRLRRVATSPQLGAPTARLPRLRDAQVPSTSAGSVVGAGFSALGSGNNQVLVLLVALVAVTLVGAAAAARRTRR